VVDKSTFSKALLEAADAKSPGALDRIALAKSRIQSVLDREIIAHQKTLEQKIADQGPKPMRVDPHLVGLAIKDLLALNRLKAVQHAATGSQKWYANILTQEATYQPKLDQLAPLYASVSGGGFGNLTGDALEIITFKCLDAVQAAAPRYAYQGAFDLSKRVDGRHPKIQPPKTIGICSTIKEADFIQYGHDAGPLCIECKNYREWLYPHRSIINEVIIKAYELNCIPVLVMRRIHYTTRSNFLEPAGIIAHESYFQYYPTSHADIAEQVRHKRSLGFTDVRATEDPHPRTTKFFSESLPKIVSPMAERWLTHRDALYEYAKGGMNLAQLYTIIGSPAGGKWQDYSQDPPDAY
jgi:hypothetical protein